MSKEMIFARVEPEVIIALDNAAKSMKETNRSRLIRIIILDWLEKFPLKNTSK